MCRSLAGAGVTANQVTIAAALLSLVLGGLVAFFPGERWPLFLIPIGLLARMALNAIDGMLAREHGMKSALGGILNEVGDVVSDAALYLPFALIPGLSAPLVVVIVMLALTSEVAGMVAVQIGASRRYDGPMGKSDRAFVFGLLALLLGVGLEAGRWASIGLAAVAILLVLTIVNRARRALSERR
jgi:CDP-diacylglycerol--glycerol-3-phosphate 3-phosphatidyltransferase